MIELPDSIKHIFFTLMLGKTSMNEFEHWVYTSKELETAIPEDDYLDLISFNYNKKAAKYELIHQLEKIVNLGEFETFRLTLLLHKAKHRNNDLPGVLEQFYDLYCDGYGFLNNLGMGFGLSMRFLPAPYKVEHWLELTPPELADLVNKISPSLEDEIDKIINWLHDKKIILTGKRGEYNRYEFIDNRGDY